MGWSIVPEWLAWDPSVTPGQMRTYVALTGFAGGSAVVWPSIATLAARTGRSSSAVRRDLEQLAVRGAVEIIPWGRPDGGQTSNRYKLLAIAHAPKVQPGGPLAAPAAPKAKSGRFTIDPPFHPVQGAPVTHDSPPLSPVTPHEGYQGKSINEGLGQGPEQGPEQGPKDQQLQLLDWTEPGPADSDAFELRLWQMRTVAKGQWAMFPVRLSAVAARPEGMLFLVKAETQRDLGLLERLAFDAGVDDLALIAA